MDTLMNHPNQSYANSDDILIGCELFLDQARLEMLIPKLTRHLTIVKIFYSHLLCT